MLKLEISYQSYNHPEGFGFLLEDFFFLRLYFCIGKYLYFHNSSFALRYLFNVNGKATRCDTPLVFCF